MTETIFIQNLKCSGCASTIVNAVRALPEVKNVEVDMASAAVRVETAVAGARPKIAAALRQAGYPEAGEANPFSRKAKSYVSCAIGRMTK